MDAQIRRLVVTGTEQNDVQILSDACQKLRQNFQVNLVQGKDTIGQDIYVLLAESALDLNANSIADECLQMFFSSSPVKSQFVGRAYLCQFRIYMPKTAQDFASLNNAIPFLQKCLTFASASPRYQFLVYNASVIYYNYVRPFFRDGYRKYLCDSFQQVIDTLKSINDEQDFSWQAQLLFDLVRCYMDADNIDKAREISTELLQLCQKQQLALLPNVLQFLTVNNIIEKTTLLSYAPKTDPSSLFKRLLIDLASIHREILENNITNQINEKLKKVYDKIIALPLRSAAVNKVNKDSTPRDNMTARPEKTLTSYEKHRLLNETGRLSLLLRYTDLTKVILEALGNIRLKEPEYLLEVRLLQAEYMVKSLGENEELYNKSSVEIRIRAIELTEETIESLQRTGQSDLVQTGCIILWNLCLPLLQTNLRNKIRRPLTTLVNILERIQSLNWLLRSQVHFELAKIEEDIEQLDSAKTNLLKAKQLDDTSVYSDRINLALERLNLRGELYKVPDNVDDRVGIIIEQAGKTISGNKNKQRALLIDACLLLAPDAFQVVLDSENPNAIGKMRANPTAQLKGFADHYEKCIQNISHYERIMTETDQDKRLKLWADLTMMARRQEIWDVCRTAARFCLLYDNEQRRSLLNVADESSLPNVFQRDLIRILAEIHFIAGEAEIEFIRERRIELFDTPVRPPMPTIPAAQRAQAQQESDHDWKYYCQWLQLLSVRACAHFSSGASLGQLLNESWLICRAGEYLWNYTRHLFYSNRFRFVLDPLSTIVNGLRKVGYEREILLLVNLCVSLANAYITPLSLPTEDTKSSSNADTPSIPQQSTSGGKKGTKADQQLAASVNTPIPISSTIVKNEDFKTALDICEYAITQTNEEVAKPLSVSIRDRQTLLQLWVTIKQLLQQSIKTSVSTILGDEEENTSSLNTLSRAVIAVDALSRLDSGWNDSREGMNLKQTTTFVDQCAWSDPLIELQLWSRLGIIANRANDTETALYCRDKTLELITIFQTRKVEKFQLSLANEYVSRACGAYAECLLKQQTGQKQERKEVLAIIVEAASYSSKADLYELTMHLARHFWNTCRLSIKRKLERSLLLDPLNELIHHINTVAPKSIVSTQNEKTTKDEFSNPAHKFRPKKQPLTSRKDKKANALEDTSQLNLSLAPQEEAQIRSALYGVVVQIYMDRHAWHSALDVIDSALQVLPRTQHRLLLYKYRVLIKSKLGLSISTDMLKFRELGELGLAKMWRQVAIMARKRDHVINAYQHAIATLQSMDNYWAKIDYILELATWLYSNEYFMDNVVDLINWIIDLLLTSPEVYQQQELNSVDGQDTDIQNSQEQNEYDSDQPQIGSVKPKAPNRAQPDLSIDDVVQVRRLEYLCRCHILLAYMTRRNQPEYPELLQQTYWLLIRLWQCGLSDSNEITKDVEIEAAAAAAAAALAGGTDTGKKQQKGAPDSESKKKPQPVTAGKSVDKPATTNIKPNTSDTSATKSLSEWAVFIPTDEVLQTYTLPQSNQRGFNKSTISKPLLSFYYLDMFVRLLREYGYNHMSLPVLSFMRLIGQTLVQSSSIRTYVLLSIQQVCQELNLLEPMQTVCQLARPFTIRDDDLAVSRAEMISYTNLLVQQREDEAQLKATVGSSGSVFKSETRSYGTSAYSSSTSRMKASDLKSKIADLPGDRQVLNKLITRNIWLQTANILFELNYIQEAKEMLQEILTQAKTYDDQTCEKRAYILLGEIALHEHRFDQAIDLAMQGQQVPIDEYEWYRSVNTVIETLRQDTNQDSYKQKKVRSLLDTAVKRLESIVQLHINKITSIAYTASLLTSKRIEVEMNEILNDSTINTSENKSVFYRLYDILQQYDMSFTNMLNLDRYNDACEIVLTRSVPIWRRFARDTANENEQKKYLCRALNILEHLTEILAQRWYLIRTVTPHNDLISIQLPIQRQFVRVQLEIITILLDLLKIYANEMFKDRLRRKHTHTTYLAVQDFVGKDGQKIEHNGEDSDIINWDEMIQILPDKLIASLMAVLEIIGTNDKSTKAKILFYLAQVYFILGQNVGTDYPLEWNTKIKEIVTKLHEFPTDKAALRRMDSRTNSNMNQVTNPAENEWIPEELLAEFNRQKTDLNHSMSYLAQSMEFALQSLNLSLVVQDKILIRDNSLLISDTIGQFDPITSIIYLTLSQSANASIYTKNVLKQACSIPSDSELASLFTLINRIKADETITNANNGVVYRTVMERLKTYWPWKYMTIRSQYHELTKEMPSLFNFLVLHYSSNGDVLYAALFNSKTLTGKGTTTGATKGNAKGSTSGTATPQIMKINVDKRKLTNLINKFDQWKQEYSQLLQQYDLKLQRSRDKQAMLNSEQPDPVDISSINELRQRFIDELLLELNEYFSPIKSLLSNYLDSEKQYESRSTLSSDHLILLIDPRLAHLPLESLDIFRHVQIGGISRDFSIQSVYNRLNPTIGIDETTAPVDDGKGKKGGAKEAGEVTSEVQVIDSSNTYYLMEPVLLKSSTENKTTTPFDLLRQKFPQLISKWKTTKQDGPTINTVELERIISEAQGVVYYGAHTLSELVGPYKCPTLSKNGCTILCSFDRTSTSFVNTPLSLINNNDHDSIQLDRSTETALLWSSGGVKSILLNQWKSTINENENILINTFTDSATLHCSLSQALRLNVYPYFRPVEIDPAAATTSKDAKNKGNASTNKKDRSPSPKNKQQQPIPSKDTNKKSSSSAAHPTNVNSDVSSEIEPKEEIQRPTLQLQQLNIVIFGLPNLTFIP
ncbi:unnamed protein product [Adineta steineri]|uniref:Uncharacterized protein n=1 Tax=Adineta steineri TaxID=433720 RepID=A0A815HSN6_9BILA|nr:unnamed protein product [Adineta steineri]